MTPGTAPPRRAAAAWPNSWKPAENTVTAITSSSSPGLSNASCAAAARPRSSRTHQHTTRNASSTTAISTGLNRRANGDVIRRVRSGSLTAYLNRSASSGLDFLTSGWLPSGLVSRPSGRSWSSTSVRTLSPVTVVPKPAVTCSATSSYDRRPSIADSTR